jgi:uncharacterized protein
MTKIILILFLLLTGCTQKQNHVNINGHIINIEVVDTESKKTEGLSNRNILCPECGMLFIFDKPGNYGFWMKDMNFPLDFVFINNNRVIDLKQNISPETYPSTITASSAFDKVLEVNSGYVSKYNLKIGQSISLTNY